MHVYCLDVLHRLQDIKASITSVFGSVLKLDLTKKVVKKLAGRLPELLSGVPTWEMNTARFCLQSSQQLKDME